MDPDAADACDLCLLPFHSHCLNVVEHPLEDYTICLDCNPKAEARATKANEASSDQVDAEALLIRMLQFMTASVARKATPATKATVATCLPSQAGGLTWMASSRPLSNHGVLTVWLQNVVLQ